MFTDSYKKFLDLFFQTLKQNNIDLSAFKLDHIAYYTATTKEYDEVKHEFLSLGEEIHESLVGGRRVSVLKLNNPFRYKEFKIDGLELVEPKQGQVIKSGFEHAEFVIPELKTILEKYPDIDWDASMMDREEYPKIQYKFKNGVGIKFHPEHIFVEAGSYKK